MSYTLYGRTGWGSTIVEAQLVWYGLPFTYETVGDLLPERDGVWVVGHRLLSRVTPARVPLGTWLRS